MDRFNDFVIAETREIVDNCNGSLSNKGSLISKETFTTFLDNVWLHKNSVLHKDSRFLKEFFIVSKKWKFKKWCRVTENDFVMV